MPAPLERPLENPVQHGLRLISGHDARAVRDNRVDARETRSAVTHADAHDPAVTCNACGRKIPKRSIRAGSALCPRCRPDAPPAIRRSTTPRAFSTRNEERKRQVRDQAGDPLVYNTRLGYQGHRDPQRRVMRLIKLHGKWQWLDVRNAAHRATATVHDGTIKALETNALPETPSLSWWYMVDKNVARDQRRKEARDRAAVGALTAGAVLDEQELPATPVSKGTNPQRPAPRYLPPVAAPHVRLARPDELAEAIEALRQHEELVATKREQLEAWRAAGNVSALHFDMLRRNLTKDPYTGSRTALLTLSRDVKQPPATVTRWLTEALDSLARQAGMTPLEIRDAFEAAYPDV